MPQSAAPRSKIECVPQIKETGAWPGLHLRSGCSAPTPLGARGYGLARRSPGAASFGPAPNFQEWGAGIALPGDADAAAMRAAAQSVLADPTYRRSAGERATMLQGVDGAATAADEVAALLAATTAWALAG